MNPVTRKYMVQLGRIQINDRGNVGLVWHAGNKPRAEATRFVGNAAGNQTGLFLDTSNPNISAAQVSAAMLQHVLQQCRVRLVRYRLLYRTIHVSGGIQVLFDQTRVGFVSVVGVPGAMGNISSLFAAGSDISLQTFTDYYEKLYNRYIATYRNTPTLLTDTICHNNCHDSCYGSRTRR